MPGAAAEAGTRGRHKTVAALRETAYFDGKIAWSRLMTETTTKAAEPVTIKKYANRRLYNTGTSTYVTLEDLAAMVKNGEDFVVYDAKTGEEITRSVLTQIIFEQENKEGQNLLPIAFLRQLIRFYGDSMQMLVPRYLEVSIESLTREQEKFRQQMAQAFGVGAFTSLEEQVRRNMEMFERAFAMFAPFARRETRAARRRRSRKNRRRKRGEIDDLKRQLDEMQTKSRSADGAGRRIDSLWSFRSLRQVCQPGPSRSPRGRQARPADNRSPKPAKRCRRGFVLHPFGDGLQLEPFGEVDERAHEGAIVLRAA